MYEKNKTNVGANKMKVKFIALLIGILLLFTNLVSAMSDTMVWQGQYYTGTTFNKGTYVFNFTVYDDLTGGNSCYTNTTTLTTGNWGEWKTEQNGVNSACNDVTKDYFLNINIDGVDQLPRRRLTLFNNLRKNVNEITTGNITASYFIGNLASGYYDITSQKCYYVNNATERSLFTSTYNTTYNSLITPSNVSNNTLFCNGAICLSSTSFIPYTGANKNVDLGAYNITSTGFAQFAWIDKLSQSVNPPIPPANTLRLFVKNVSGINIYQYLDSSGMIRQTSDQVFVVYNNFGEDIPIYSAVYSTGSYDNLTTIGLARADSLSTMPCIGVTIEEIPNGTSGRIMQNGILQVDTTEIGVSPDTPVYVSDSNAGGWQFTPPISPSLTQQMGVIDTIDTNGQVQVILGNLKGNEFGTAQDSFIIGSGIAGNKALTFNDGTYHNIEWDNTASRFEVGDSLNVVGDLNMTGNLKVGGCIEYNCSQPTGCVVLGTCV